MKMLASIAFAVAVIMPVAAGKAHELSRETEGVINTGHENGVLETFEKAREEAAKLGTYYTSVPYADMPYAVTFDVAQRLRQAGYDVSIDRASRLLHVSW